MSGETKLAKNIVDEALAIVEGDAGKTKDALLNALLSQVLSELVQHRSRADLMSYIEYHLDNADETDWVITRGC